MTHPGERIREFRELRGMTIAELANAAGMRPQFLESIEEGTAFRVHTFTFQKLADALHVTLGMVLGEELPPRPGVGFLDEVPEDYRFVVRWVVRLTFFFGSLVLLFGVIVVFLAALVLALELLSGAWSI